MKGAHVKEDISDIVEEWEAAKPAKTDTVHTDMASPHAETDEERELMEWAVAVELEREGV